MAFPTNLDSLVNPAAGDKEDVISHSDQHINANDAIEAIEAKVGVDGSAVATSIDYFLKHASGAYRTHQHDGTSDDGAKLDWDNCWLDAIHDHSSNAEGGSGIAEADITFNASGHDHTGTTAGNLIPAGGLENDSVITTKILDENVTSRKMAPTIIEKVSTGTTSINSGTETDLTGATITLTPEIASTAIILASVGVYGNTAGDIFIFYIDIDGTNAGSTIIYRVPNNNSQFVLSSHTIQLLTAASHTIKLQGARTSGTGAAETYANNTKLTVILFGDANTTNDAAG